MLLNLNIYIKDVFLAIFKFFILNDQYKVTEYNDFFFSSDVPPLKNYSKKNLTTLIIIDDSGQKVKQICVCPLHHVLFNLYYIAYMPYFILL